MVAEISHRARIIHGPIPCAVVRGGGGVRGASL